MKLNRIFVALFFICSSCHAAGSDIDKEDLVKFASVVSIAKNNSQADNSSGIINNAITGVMAKFDQYSSFIQDMKSEFIDDIVHGEFSKVGIVFSNSPEGIKVISPTQGGPAEKAGLQPNDIITMVDGKLISEANYQEILEKTEKKTDGNATKFKIVRYDENNNASEMAFNLVPVSEERPIIKMAIKNNIAFIQASTFAKGISEKFSWQLKDISDNQEISIDGIIIDLRNANGSNIEEATKMADMIIDGKKEYNPKLLSIVKTKPKAQEKNIEYTTTPGDLSQGLPVITIINNGTAEAAEAFASILQEHKRSIIIGEHSYGKWSIQELFPLNGNSSIKITTSSFVTGLGKSNEGVGINPNITVKQTDYPQNDWQPTQRNQITHTATPKQQPGNINTPDLLNNEKIVPVGLQPNNTLNEQQQIDAQPHKEKGIAVGIQSGNKPSEQQQAALKTYNIKTSKDPSITKAIELIKIVNTVISNKEVKSLFSW